MHLCIFLSCFRNLSHFRNSFPINTMNVDTVIEHVRNISEFFIHSLCLLANEKTFTCIHGSLSNEYFYVENILPFLTKRQKMRSLKCLEMA